MQIKEMFRKEIDRELQGVIVVGQGAETNVAQELEEYVVTRELQRHFADFFAAYKKGILGTTPKMGVWISGFFGSGKSHYIKHELEKRLIVLKGDTQPVITMTQNIENVNGNVVQQQSGNITINTNNNGVSGEDLNGLIEKIISSLSEIKDVDTEEVDSVKDDLESLQEQIQSPTPKKNRMQKALNGVQKFFSDFGMKVAVTVAAKVVTSQDWTALIQQAQLFIGNL